MERSNEGEGICCGIQVFGCIIICQFERCDPYNNQKSGKMPVSTGITILTGRDVPMIAQVNIYSCGMCRMHSKRRVLLPFTGATIIDLKFKDESQR